MLCTSGFVDDVVFSHNGPIIQIQTWSLLRSELFTVTRPLVPLISAAGGEVLCARLFSWTNVDRVLPGCLLAVAKEVDVSYDRS